MITLIGNEPFWKGLFHNDLEGKISNLVCFQPFKFYVWQGKYGLRPGCKSKVYLE